MRVVLKRGLEPIAFLNAHHFRRAKRVGAFGKRNAYTCRAQRGDKFDNSLVHIEN